ncbi:hypothetical protein NUH86_22795 (plasmid) [Sphingobium sp. JS3065]|uniref:hypothetical protein n=1 Tax=Sphingobium sp. JS3065 TaxID=2970925 RepID=UPI002263BB9A|nr:hypothetical protein [Sphingobium sp. JS3065]UZW57842.1 hypothetical protein NUH86_22795 [Sphingobium sp. JS3065]
MNFTASDAPSRHQPFDWEMTAFELAVFICIYRSPTSLLLDEVRREVSLWFERVIGSEDLKGCIGYMLGRGWLLQSGDRLRASNRGRIIARPLVNGLIRMLDQGTRLLDVALMMSILRLTHDQLANPVEDDG